MNNIFSEPRDPKFEDCYFYHTMDVPDHGVVRGEWDLRGKTEDYLGHVKFSDKRVLEFGTGSGYLSFFMESQGAAEVVSVDIDRHLCWDIVPFAGVDMKKIVSDRKASIEKLNNSFWFMHKCKKSKVKMLYSKIYDIPDMGKFDIVTLSSILLHLRDPFSALYNATKNGCDIVVVSEKAEDAHPISQLFSNKKVITFRPEFISEQQFGPFETWWHIYPDMVKTFLSILGFGKFEHYKYSQKYEISKRDETFYTIVGHRVREMQVVDDI